MIAYLSGPIENASNNGSRWRDLMTDWLKTNLNHNVFNPVIETKSIVKQNLDSDFRMMKNGRILNATGHEINLVHDETSVSKAKIFKTSTTQETPHAFSPNSFGF